MRTETRTNQPFSKSGLGANRLKLFLLFIHIVPDLFHWRIHAFERRLFIRNRPPTPRQSLSSFSFFFFFVSNLWKIWIKESWGNSNIANADESFPIMSLQWRSVCPDMYLSISRKHCRWVDSSKEERRHDHHRQLHGQSRPVPHIWNQHKLTFL